MKRAILVFGLAMLNFACGVIVGALGLLTLLAYGVVKLQWLTLR